MNSERNTVFDFIADVLSGRVQNTLTYLNQQNLALMGRINQLEGELRMATQNEQAILDIAQGVRDNTNRIAGVLSSMEQKIQTLISQAQSPTPVEDPEDLSQELQELRDALGGLGQIGTTLEETAPTIDNGSGTGIVPPADVAVEPSLEPQDMPPVEPTPLAGESGTTNPIVEGGGPIAGAQAPGTGTVTAGEAPVADEGTASEDSVAETDGIGNPVNAESDVVTTTPNISELETGVAQQEGVAVGDGGGSTSEPTGTTPEGETMGEATGGSADEPWR